MDMFDHKITIDAAKRNGKPCLRDTRITVEDILRWLASGMSVADITQDFPEITAEDVFTALAFAANRTQRISIAS